MISDQHKSLIGRIHTFDDGIKLRIVDIKQREECPWITYETQHVGAIPKRFSLKLKEFLDKYGHLFQNS